MAIEGYFFYSEKQKKEQCGAEDNKENYCKLKNSGEIVEYTEMRTSTNKPFGDWDDYIYLGWGEYHHLEER